MAAAGDTSDPILPAKPVEEAETRVLFALPYSPRLDARHGGKTVAQLLASLSDRHRIAIVHLRRPGEEPPDEVLRRRCDVVEAVTVADPAARRTRLRRAFRLARAVGTQRVPIQVSDFASREYAERLRDVARSWRPHVVHVELEAMAQYLRALDDSDAARVLVLVEPAARTADELTASTSGLSRVIRSLDSRAWRTFEADIAGLADAVVVLTDGDRDAATVVAGGARVETVPIATELPAEPLDPIGSTPPRILFFGGFGHAPNVRAATRLARRIFPLIVAEMPEAQLDVVGDKPPQAIRALAAANVSVTGRVPALRPYLDEAAVVAAPIDVGGGMRLKVLETLAAGKALVATPLAVEGLALRNGEHAVVAESDEALAGAILRLLDDPDERRRLAERGRAWAEENLGLQRVTSAYERIYHELRHAPRPE